MVDVPQRWLITCFLVDFRLPELIRIAGEQIFQSPIIVLAHPASSWKISHILAGGGDFLPLEDFLKKLPRDGSQALLVQQSKKYLDTVREFIQHMSVMTDLDDSP